MNDAKLLAKDVSNTGHLGNGHYELIVSDDQDIDYIVSLVKQSYKKNGV